VKPIPRSCPNVIIRQLCDGLCIFLIAGRHCVPIKAAHKVSMEAFEIVLFEIG